MTLGSGSFWSIGRLESEGWSATVRGAVCFGVVRLRRVLLSRRWLCGAHWCRRFWLCDLHLLWRRLADAFVLSASSDGLFEGCSSVKRFLALIFGIRRLASNGFKLLVAQARRITARENQVRKISQEDALDGQRGNVVDKRIKSNLVGWSGTYLACNLRH